MPSFPDAFSPDVYKRQDPDRQPLRPAHVIAFTVYMADKQPFPVSVLTKLVKKMITPLSCFPADIHIPFFFQFLKDRMLLKRNPFYPAGQPSCPVIRNSIHQGRCFSQKNHISSGIGQCFQPAERGGTDCAQIRHQYRMVGHISHR